MIVIVRSYDDIDIDTCDRYCSSRQNSNRYLHIYIYIYTQS